MRNFRVFMKAMLIKGHWKYSGKTNKLITNGQRMWLAFSMLIASLVTLATFGRITCWADIFMGLKYASDTKKGNCNYFRRWPNWFFWVVIAWAIVVIVLNR
ncbi:hypothetical protein LCGC14_0220300 [marine sediment metagenome]|uniref:Uncharacterized protein n=1 Tax=marine sediment metagenome TaxID=412755 RepID=A0A0F9UHM5_9ZZZZ